MANGLSGLLGALSYQFSILQNKQGQFYFVFHNTHGNTEPICWSEAYTTRQSCAEAANKVKVGAASAPVV